MNYGTAEGVARYVRRLTGNTGTFDQTSTPTLADVQGFLDQASAMLNGWLAASGYVVPVTQADAVSVLDGYAELGAAGLVELSQRAGGYDAEDENRRENKFLKMFMAAEGYIDSGALAALGAATTGDGAPPGLSGFRVGGTTVSGAAVRPMFSRRMFNNQPGAETPPGRELD